MMQYFGNGRIDIAITLQCRESSDCGLIAATSSDCAVSWDKVALRDENGGPVHLIYSAGASNTGLEAGPSFADQPERETSKHVEVPFYPTNDASGSEDPMAVDAVGMNVNATYAQALPAAATPHQAIETAVFSDWNATTDPEDHRETPEMSSALTLRAPDGPLPQDEAAPNATQTFEAGGPCDGGAFSPDDTPLDEPEKTHDHARQAIDKEIAGEESVDRISTSPEPERAIHDMPASPEPEQATLDTPTSSEPEQAFFDTPTSPEPEQASHDGGPQQHRREGSLKRKDRSPSPPVSGHKRTYRSHDDGDDDEDSSDDDAGNGRRPEANSSNENPLAENDASYDALTETLREWRPNTQHSSPPAAPNFQWRSTIQQGTLPTSNDGPYGKSKHGGESKQSGHTRALDEHYDDSYGISNDTHQIQTEMPLRPAGTPSHATPSATIPEDDELLTHLTESMRTSLQVTQPQPSAPHAVQNTPLGLAVQQSTLPTFNGEHHGQPKRGEKRKYAGTRDLVEDYNDSDDDGDKDEEDDDEEDDDEEDDDEEDDDEEDDDEEDDDEEDDDEDDDEDDEDESDSDEDDEDGDDGNQGAEIQGAEIESANSQRVESQATNNQGPMDQGAEEQGSESQDVKAQDAVGQDASPNRSQDESDARPETTQPEDSEDEDGDFEPDDSSYEASDSGSDSEGNASDFNLSDTEVQDLQSAPGHTDAQASHSAPDDSEDDESEDESESAPENSGDDEGEIQLEGRRADSDSGEADDEFESDDESDCPDENNSAEDSESDVVSSDDSNSEYAYSSDGSDYPDSLLGYKC
jgi:hypothetical protein